MILVAAVGWDVDEAIQQLRASPRGCTQENLERIVYAYVCQLEDSCHSTDPGSGYGYFPLWGRVNLLAAYESTSVQRAMLRVSTARTKSHVLVLTKMNSARVSATPLTCRWLRRLGEQDIHDLQHFPRSFPS